MPLNTTNPGVTSTLTSGKPVAELFHNEVTAWLVLALSLTITGLGWFLASEAIEKRAAENFKFEVREAQERVESRMKQYEQVLRGGVALFDSQAEVTRAEWQVYTRSLDLQKALPGLQGFAYAPRVDAGGLNAHETAVRSEGFPDYAVTPAGAREMYFPISLIEPFDARNQRAFAFDMYSEPVRKQAIDHAKPIGGRAPITAHMVAGLRIAHHDLGSLPLLRLKPHRGKTLLGGGCGGLCIGFELFFSHQTLQPFRVSLMLHVW